MLDTAEGALCVRFILSGLYTFTSYDSPAPIIWGGMNPIFRWENWGTGKVKWLAQRSTKTKWWCWDLNPRQLVRNHNPNHYTTLKCKDRCIQWSGFPIVWIKYPLDYL